MSKKIKALVQKYEKDMKFENRFDDLKHKLDLIPDVEAKSEVFVIKRKVMPAYVMIIVLLMLVTGLIGLQLGLNNDFVDQPEAIDTVEENLMNLLDIFERESVHTTIINKDLVAYIYIGIDDLDKKIVVRIESKIEGITVNGLIDGLEVTQTVNTNFVVGLAVNDTSVIQLDIYENGSLIEHLSMTLNLTEYYSWLTE